MKLFSSINWKTVIQLLNGFFFRGDENVLGLGQGRGRTAL